MKKPVEQIYIKDYLDMVYVLRFFAQHIYGEPSGNMLYDILLKTTPNEILNKGGYAWHKTVVEQEGSTAGTAIQLFLDRPRNTLNIGIQYIRIFPCLYSNDEDKVSEVYMKDALFFMCQHYAGDRFYSLRGALTKLYDTVVGEKFDYVSDRSLRHPGIAYEFAKKLPESMQEYVAGILMAYQLRIATQK